MKRCLQLKRQSSKYPYPVPISLQTITLPDGLKKNSKGDEFLLFDSECEKRIIIFGTKQNIKMMKTTQH
ncbi:hypothetical protein GJ496_003394 [Pomphorhynchus laevis]|nr:hypothetical protein GJ496_003394 [Pomphorhynchus laevis]